MPCLAMVAWPPCIESRIPRRKSRWRSSNSTWRARRLHQRKSSPSSSANFISWLSFLIPVIEVYDYGIDDRTPYYTMELLDGGDLRERSPLPWRDVCSLLRGVCSSLALIHSRRLVHRDVTPANIRCTRDGEAKLIDFGAMAPVGAVADRRDSGVRGTRDLARACARWAGGSLLVRGHTLLRADRPIALSGAELRAARRPLEAPLVPSFEDGRRHSRGPRRSRPLAPQPGARDAASHRVRSHAAAEGHRRHRERRAPQRLAGVSGDSGHGGRERRLLPPDSMAPAFGGHGARSSSTAYPGSAARGYCRPAWWRQRCSEPRC